GAMGPECIVIELIVIESVEVIGAHADAAWHPGISRDIYLGRILRRPSSGHGCCAQAQVLRCWIQRSRGIDVDHMRAAVANTRGIEYIGAECVALLKRDSLPPGLRVQDIVVPGVGL